MRIGVIHFCTEIASESKMKLAGCKSALNHPPPSVHYTNRSTAVFPCKCYALLLCGLFYEAICFKSCLVLFCSSVCVFVFLFCFFSVL